MDFENQLALESNNDVSMKVIQAINEMKFTSAIIKKEPNENFVPDEVQFINDFIKEETSLDHIQLRNQKESENCLKNCSTPITNPEFCEENVSYNGEDQQFPNELTWEMKNVSDYEESFNNQDCVEFQEPSKEECQIFEYTEIKDNEPLENPCEDFTQTSNKTLLHEIFSKDSNG